MNEKVLERYAELMIEKIRQVSAGDWQKPWFTPKAGLPQNISGRPYNNMNRLMLYMEMDRTGYTLPVFMTFHQLKDENLMITKGSHSLPVTYYDISVKHNVTGKKISFEDYKNLPTGEKQGYKVTSFMKYFNVFNIDQTDFKEKYPERYEAMKGKFSGLVIPDDVQGNGNPQLDKIIKEQQWVCPIELEVQDRAYYSLSKDKIVLPAPGQFKDMESFQMTALHEMAHSTAHPSRLNRSLLNSFGTAGYAREEIIAEFTAAVTGRDLGIAVTPRKENAQYLKSWLSSLNEDSKFVMGILREVGKASSMIEESVEEQQVTTDTAVKGENRASLQRGASRSESPELPDEFILKASERESGIKGIAQQVEKMGISADVFKNAFPVDVPCATMYLYVADGKVTDWEPFIHENEYNLPILNLWAAERDTISGPHPEPPVMTESSPLIFKGGRRELEIAPGRAVIRTNGNEYDATGILGSLKKAGVDVRDISENQWAGMLRGQGTALDPSRPKSLFSIQKQASGYNMRIADITGSIPTAIQKEP